MSITPASSSNPNAQWINPLLHGRSWTEDIGSGTEISYSFDSDVETSLQVALRNIFQSYANISNLVFTEVDGDSGEIVIGRSELPSFYGYANWFFRGDLVNKATIDVSNTFLPDGTDFSAGTTGYSTMIHEVGHAIGLAHANKDGESEGGSPFASPLATFAQNSDYTVMVSSVFKFGTITGALGRTETPQFADVAAIQYLYGANTQYNSGDTVYNFVEQTVMTIWDGGGTDIIDAAAQTSAVVINLNEADGEAYSTLGASAFWIAGGANIENADGGSGDDVITGNALANTIRGLSGNDTITLNDGADWANGNAGNDIITAGNGDDNIRGGKDQDILTGNNGNDFVNGNLGSDSVSGGAGNDILHGGQGADILLGEAGNDQLFGDLGNDTLIGGSGANVFVFNASNSGADTIVDFVVGADTIELRSSSFASSAEAVNAFAGGVLDLGNGNTITLTGITSLAVSDIDIV